MSTRKTYNNYADTASNPGTGTFTLLGAIPSSPTLLIAPRISTGVLADQDAPDYIAVDSADNTKWEEGYGTYAASGTTLTRTLTNSSTGSLINFTGTVNIYFSFNVGGLLPASGVIGAGFMMLGSPGVAGTIAQNTTTYIAPFATAANVEALVRRFIATRAGTLQTLRVNVTTTPVSGQTYTYTVYVNGSSTGVTCTISNGSTSGSDLSHTVAVAAGDGVMLQVATSATSGSTGNWNWSVEIAF